MMGYAGTAAGLSLGSGVIKRRADFEEATHSVNSGVATDPVHGKDGWTLTSYQWDERTGIGHFQYTRNDGERREVTRRQTAWQVLRGSELAPVRGKRGAR